MLNVLGDAFLIFYALWTFVAQLSYFLGLSFEQSWLIACATGMVGVGMFFFLTRTDSASASFPAEKRTSCVVSNDAHPNSRPGAAWPRFQFMAADTLWSVACWICAIVAAAVTMCLHRPDADDITYLSYAVLALDSPAVPMRTLTVLANGYILTSYDFIRAAFSWATGVPILVSYYIIWPACIAVLVVVFQFRLFRLAGVTNIVMASVVFFVVMLAWGDVHRTPANFGFVRLFQGKGPLIWLAIPAALYCWLTYMQNKQKRPLILLYCAIIAGVGFSPTGVLTGLLVVGLFAAATLVAGKFARTCWPRVFAIGLAGLYPLVIGLLMRFYFGYSSQGVHTAAGILDSANNSEILETTLLGSNMRGAMALLAVLAAPLLLRRWANTVPLQIYFWMCIALLVFPWTSDIFAKLGYSTFSWRWFYVLPFALAMVIALDRLGRSDWPPLARFVGVAVAVSTFVFSSPRWIVSSENYTALRLPGFKLYNPSSIFLVHYGSNARIEGVWLISPATASQL